MEKGRQVDDCPCNCASHYAVFVMFISPTLDAMTLIFEGVDDLNAIDFVHGDTNPAARAIHRYFGLLYNQDDPFWRPWVAHTRFDDEGLLLALKVVFSLVGGLFMRSVLPFRMDPWRLARLVLPLSSEEDCEHEKAALTKKKCKICLDSGFSKQVWSWWKKGCSWDFCWRRSREKFQSLSCVECPH